MEINSKAVNCGLELWQDYDRPNIENYENSKNIKNGIYLKSKYLRLPQKFLILEHQNAINQLN